MGKNSVRGRIWDWRGEHLCLWIYIVNNKNNNKNKVQHIRAVITFVVYNLVTLKVNLYVRKLQGRTLGRLSGQSENTDKLFLQVILTS